MKAVVDRHMTELPNNLIVWVLFYQINVAKMTKLNGG